MGLGITYYTHGFWEAHGEGRDLGWGAAKEEKNFPGERLKKKKSHINRKAPDTWANGCISLTKGHGRL